MLIVTADDVAGQVVVFNLDQTDPSRPGYFKILRGKVRIKISPFVARSCGND